MKQLNSFPIVSSICYLYVYFHICADFMNVFAEFSRSKENCLPIFL